MAGSNRRAIVDVVTIDDDYCTIDGVRHPRVWNAFPHETNDALIAGDGEHIIALLGTSVDGTRPTTQAALVTALRGSVREPERNSLLDAIQELEDGTYTVTVTEGVVSFDEAA
jgi:hypothetical protein